MSFSFIFLLFPVTLIAGEIIKAECINYNNEPISFSIDSDGGKQQLFVEKMNVGFNKDGLFGVIDSGDYGWFINLKTGEFYSAGKKFADCKLSNLEALKKKNTEDIVADAIEGKIIQLDEMKAQLDEMKVERDEMKAELNNYLLQQSSTLKNKEGSGMPIDCSWKNMLNTLMADYYFSYVNSDYEFKPDGKYQITIYSNYINGNFRINEMVSIPYIKSKSTFAPEYDGHWSTRDLRESELEILQKKDGFSDCKIKTIVYKGE